LRNLSRHRALRFIGWAVAYVLALQTMLLGFGAVPSQAAGLTASLAIELCLTGDRDNASEQQPHAKTEHCLGCFTSNVDLPLPATDVLPVTYPSTVADPTPQDRPAPARAGRPGLPRAPPVLA